MAFSQLKCTEFTEVLASREPVPGGGGASALVGAVGAALGGMVSNLTIGKKKYAAVEEDIKGVLKKAEELRILLLTLTDRDAEVFEPLAKAYGIPKEDPTRAGIIESALRLACSVPLEIMEACCSVIELHGELLEKGSTMMLSDVGVGVICCKSALMGASLNVFINTKSMQDRQYAAVVEQKADSLLEAYCAQADKIYASVLQRLR